MLYLPQVSVQQAISLLTDSVHVRSVRWAHTSQNQAGSSASPVEEVSWPSMKHRCPSETVKPKVRLCDRVYHFTSRVCFFPLYLFIVATTRQGARISVFYINNIFPLAKTKICWYAVKASHWLCHYLTLFLKHVHAYIIFLTAKVYIYTEQHMQAHIIFLICRLSDW